jgi:hypothetical protein
MSKKPRNERTEKAKTNAKWTATPEYQANYDRIFGKKPNCELCQDTGEVDDSLGGVGPHAGIKSPCPDCDGSTSGS